LALLDLPVYLKLDELEPSRAQRVAATPSPLATSDVNRATKRARQPLPAHLSRETHKILSKQEACPDCGSALKPLGEDISEILEHVTAKYLHIATSKVCSTSSPLDLLTTHGRAGSSAKVSMPRSTAYL
jgi:zinc-finger binding domain of transposase IS66